MYFSCKKIQTQTWHDIVSTQHNISFSYTRHENDLFNNRVGELTQISTRIMIMVNPNMVISYHITMCVQGFKLTINFITKNSHQFGFILKMQYLHYTMGCLMRKETIKLMIYDLKKEEF